MGIDGIGADAWVQGEAEPPSREHSLPRLLHAFRDLVPLKTPWLGELANSPSRGSISDYSSVDTALCRAKDGDGDLKH